MSSISKQVDLQKERKEKKTSKPTNNNPLKTSRKIRRILAEKDFVCSASNPRYFPDRVGGVKQNSLCFSGTASLEAASGNTAIQSQGSATACGHDRCHWQLWSYSSLGQIIYTTALDLGLIFNLGHLLRNLFFLQRVKVIWCYCLPLSGVSFSFEEIAGYILHKAWLRTRKGSTGWSSPSLDTTKHFTQSLVVRNEAGWTIQSQDAVYVQVPFSFAFFPASGTPAPSG